MVYNIDIDGMTIGSVGAGTFGGALALAWSAYGFGVRLTRVR